MSMPFEGWRPATAEGGSLPAGSRRCVWRLCFFWRADPPARRRPPEPAWVKPGLFQLGPVRLDKAKRTVAFPAAANPAYANDPLMEYLLATNYG